MGGGESKPAEDYGYHDPFLRQDPGINQAAVDRELRFERARTNSSLASAVATFRGPERSTPVSLAQVVQFTLFWFFCAVVTALYIYELADAELRRATGACPALVVHYIFVALAIVVAIAFGAWRTWHWKHEVQGRNRRPSADGDSAVFSKENRATNPGGVLGSDWGRERSWHEGEQPIGCRSRAGPACQCGMLVAVLCIFIWHLVSFGAWMWLRANVDTADILIDGERVSKFAGLVDTVTVEWEREGMVHIRASSEADLFFGQGFVSSQLRLWQMEYQRRMVAGTLAQAVGSDAVESDKLMRTLGLYRAAEAMLGDLNAQARAAVTAYTKGVNAFLDAIKRGDRQRPLEFTVFDVTPQPWTDTDSVAWMKVMAYDLAGNMEMELHRYALLARELQKNPGNENAARARIQQLYPSYGTECPTSLNGECRTREGDAGGSYFPTVLGVGDCPTDCPNPGGAGCCAPWQGGPGQDDATQQQRHHTNHSSSHKYGTENEKLVAELAKLLKEQQAGARGERQGSQGGDLMARYGLLARSSIFKDRLGASNNWVVGGKHTATGKPILANDPHLLLTAPSVWVLMHLDCPTFRAIGASFAGTPFVVVGNNRDVAWGATATGADVQDLYILKGVSADNTAYSLDDNPATPFDIRQEKIDVSGGSAIDLTVRTSWWGPVVTDAIDKELYGGGDVLALNWTGIDPYLPDTTLNALHSFGSMTDWQGFRAAVAEFVGPSLNFVFASNFGDTGTIGYAMSGAVPQRMVGHTGEYPVPGDRTGEYAWLGYIATDQMPRSIDPPEDFIVSANNRATPSNYPLNITQDWDSRNGYRARGISLKLSNAISQPKLLSVDDMKEIQLDTTSQLATDLKTSTPTTQSLLASLPAGSLSNDAQDWQKRLLSWDADMAVGSREASMFAAWTVELSKLVATETGRPYWSDWAFLRAAYTFGDPSCGGLGDAAACGAQAAAALNAAVRRLGASSVDWGDAVHLANFEHPVLGDGALSCLTNRQVRHGGDESSANVGGFDPASNAFSQHAGPSYRQVVDVGSLGPVGELPQAGPNSWFLAPVGQSGNPLHEWYDNVAEQWATGGYWQMHMLGYHVETKVLLQPAA